MSTKARLKRLADYLWSLSAESEIEFDLSFWRYENVACAVGHACMLPEFQEAGLHFDADDTPSFGLETSWAAVMSFFDIPIETAHLLFSSFLFSDKRQNDPKAVASRVYSYLERQNRSSEESEQSEL